jgi:uncharacterized protein with ParB-like and HNH nuclease domain
MPKPNRLTNNSDETDIAALISGDTVFSIPYFQRAYKWKPERLKQLERDILGIVDTGELHFLGPSFSTGGTETRLTQEFSK